MMFSAVFVLGALLLIGAVAALAVYAGTRNKK